MSAVHGATSSSTVSVVLDGEIALRWGEALAVYAPSFEDKSRRLDGPNVAQTA
jgi:hypothetical protein